MTGITIYIVVSIVIGLIIALFFSGLLSATHNTVRVWHLFVFFVIAVIIWPVLIVLAILRGIYKLLTMVL